MRSHLRTRLPPLAILLMGLALRLYRLGTDSLWYDETVSTALAGSPLTELIRHTAGDIHPPGYYILLRGWLLLTGYPAGHADPTGNGLEFAAGFFSLFFGVLLIALAYTLARRVAGPRVAAIAAALIALSPYNVWYSQEVRMYTLAATLGAMIVYALVQVTDGRRWMTSWWAVYAVAAAAGMYTLYYFAFLLIPLNLWALWRMADGRWQVADGGSPMADGRRQRADSNSPFVIRNSPFVIRNSQFVIRNSQFVIRNSPFILLLLANGLAALLYAPWIPIAWRQATNPPVPPWRTVPDLLSALRESWTALSLGQSAPAWLWPILLLTLALYTLGLIACWQIANGKWQIAQRVISHQPPAISHTPHQIRNTQYVMLPFATFGPLALILLVSLFTPLYHVRYLFTYSPAFYVVLAAGLSWLWGRRVGLPSLRGKGGRGLGVAAALIWLAAAGVTLRAFWFDPAFRADDHRAAVRFLREQWRPGDVVLVNAGWAYTALTTYWDGPIAGRSRLSSASPASREDDALIIVTTGHVDGDPDLGWADPRSDFFALPADTTQTQLAALFDRFNRVWQYRIYDTVNDPTGRIRAWLAEGGQPFEERAFPGEAFIRVQGFITRQARSTDQRGASAIFAPGLTLHTSPLPGQIASGATLYPVLDWQFLTTPSDFATSLRLIGPDGVTWAQGVDERPAGSAYPASRWPASAAVRQTAALRVPPGTPPGSYVVELVVYDPATGQPWPAQTRDLGLTSNGVRLGEVTVTRHSGDICSGDFNQQAHGMIEVDDTKKPLARFGPLRLVEASSPVTSIAPGGQIPVDLLWQAVTAPGESLVVVIQLQDAASQVVAGLEEEPIAGRYPTQFWQPDELVRDRHTLAVPAMLAPGPYRLIVGVYRAIDRQRLVTPNGLFGKRDYWAVKTVEVQ